jgi:hypothetical protein
MTGAHEGSPLWTDQRISDEVGLRFSKQQDWGKAIKVATLVRNEYETKLSICSEYADKVTTERDAALAKIAELEAQLAAHPDAGDVDWTQAPEWANWRAVDPNGWAHWFQEEPIKLMTINYSGWVAKTINGIQQGAELWASEVDLPLGVDWRETLRQRRKQEG